MSEARIVVRWVKHVIRGEGKPRSDSAERFSYRGPVLYSEDWPVARLVKGPKDWVCVTKTGVIAHNPPEWIGDGKPRLSDASAYVSCVGVFSKFEGDMCSDEELHKRTEWLMYKEAERLIENAQVWPIDKIVKKTAWRGTGREMLIRDMSSAAKRYAKYSELFGLKWAPWPAMYMSDLMDALAKREKVFMNPKAVAARERQQARKAAKVALGLE